MYSAVHDIFGPVAPSFAGRRFQRLHLTRAARWERESRLSRRRHPFLTAQGAGPVSVSFRASRVPRPGKGKEVRMQPDPRPPRPLIGVRALSKRFGSVTALDRLDFEAFEGQVTAVVGDNGSGKSTLLKILSGNLAPDKGAIRVEGREHASLSIREALDLGVGMVYQDLSLDDCKSSAENIFLGHEPLRCGLFLDKRRMEREAAELLDRLRIRLPDVRLPVGNLSGGQRQGVALARALRARCRILLLDEPTAAMGLRESHAVMALLRTFRQAARPLTQILVSHNLFQVFDLADRVCVLRNGRLLAEAATADTSPEALHRLLLEREAEWEEEGGS